MKKQPTITAPAADGGISKGLRNYLYVTAAITGAAVLVVEILGAKMLSPYVGTSHFVWTAQIATTLVALATGYFIGGKLADKSPRIGTLYVCILVAAVFLAFTVLLCEPAAYYFLRWNLAAGALCSSAFLFFVPLTLLAMTGPFLVRVLTSSVSVVGTQTGRLSGISTLGSVAGTVLIGYVLIPFLPNSVTMYVTAMVLTVTVLVYFFGWGRRGGSNGGIVMLALFGAGAGLLGVRIDQLRKFPAGQELYRANSNFGLLQVFETRTGSRRYYLNDFLVQNTYETEHKRSNSLFTYMLHDLAAAYAPETRNVLCIGMGIGIVPMRFASEGANVDVVEINSHVVEPASRFFNFQPEKLHLTIGDGRYFLHKVQKKYDAIVLDAFLGDSSPSHLMTKEAFTSMKEALGPEGVLVINSFGDFDPGKDFFMASLEKTLKSVFASVRIHASGNGNVFFVGSAQRELRIRREPNTEAAPNAIAQEIKDAFAGIRETDPKSGRVLTDDYNPVEFYDAQNREGYRKRLALSMRGRE